MHLLIVFCIETMRRRVCKERPRQYHKTLKTYCVMYLSGYLNQHIIFWKNETIALSVGRLQGFCYLKYIVDSFAAVSTVYLF